jgi:hypothetical protein
VSGATWSSCRSQVWSRPTCSCVKYQVGREPGIGPAQLTCPNTDTDHSNQSVPVLLLRCSSRAGPHDASSHAGQVVRRVLLRRNIVIDAETAARRRRRPSRAPGRGRRPGRRAGADTFPRPIAIPAVLMTAHARAGETRHPDFATPYWPLCPPEAPRSSSAKTTMGGRPPTSTRRVRDLGLRVVLACPRIRPVTRIRTGSAATLGYICYC